MHTTLEFPELLRLIDERAGAFRAAIAAAPDLEVRVPTCPEWTLFELAQHLVQGRRAWALTVGAGPAETRPAEATAAREQAAPREREALLAELADSTRQLLDALREAGPDRGCWTWWGTSQSPQTCGAVARHQLQEIAMHTYDAQLAIGARRSIPAEVALDGVDDFVFTCCATTSPWPHEPATVDYLVTEGRSWRLRLDADGARAARIPAPDAGDASADLTARASAGELLLVLYGRAPADSLKIDGDRRILDRLADWDPGA